MILLFFPVSLRKHFHFIFSIYFSFLCVFSTSALLPSHYLLSIPKSLLGMGRFAHLVDSEEGIESFRALYSITPGAFIRYCKEGEWHKKRQEEEAVIPMISFIEGGMRIPMGTITRGYLKAHRLAPTQCAPNMFKILESINAVNERMGLGLTHHDINWV